MGRSRDISKNRFHFWVHHMMFYIHAMFVRSRLSRTEISRGGGGWGFPRASNTLGMIGLKHQLKQVFLKTHGKLLGLLLCTKMEIGLISQTIAPYQSYLSFQGSLKKLVTYWGYQHVEDNGLFSSGQSAYLRLHSNASHLLKSTDDWYNGLDLGKLVV